MPNKFTFLLIALFAPLVAQAADLSISPASFNFNLRAGQSTNRTVIITNHSAEEVALTATNGARPESGADFNDWTTIAGEKNFTLPPNNKREISFSTKVPADIKTGSYRSVLLITESNNGDTEGASLASRLAANIDVNVLGSDEPGKLWETAASQLTITNVQNTARWWPKPLKYSFTVTNIGPWKGTPHGVVRLANTKGKHYQAIINGSRQPLLPGQSATYDVSVPINWSVGKFNTEILVSLMNEKPAVYTKSVTVFPWGLPIALMLLITSFYWRRRKRSRR